MYELENIEFIAELLYWNESVCTGEPNEGSGDCMQT